MKDKNSKPKSKDELAEMIARTFKEEDRTPLYKYIFQEHDEKKIRNCFEEAKKVPDDRIKKSRSALFFYLLNRYGE